MCVSFQLAFCSNDESSISSKRGNYVELLHTLAPKDERLARHLETTTAFSGFSNIIQNDLIAAIGDVKVKLTLNTLLVRSHERYGMHETLLKKSYGKKNGDNTV